MSDQQSSLNSTWRAIVEDLIRRSEQPNSEVPTFTAQQRIYLQLLKPIMINDGYALLATPDQNGRDIVEAELSTHIAAGLSRQMGRPCSIAVTVAPPQEVAQSQTQPAPQMGQFDVEEQRPRLNQVDVTNQNFQEVQPSAYEPAPDQNLNQDYSQQEHNFRSPDSAAWQIG